MRRFGSISFLKKEELVGLINLESISYLRSIGIWSCVGHGQNSFPYMLQGKVFISKLVTINGLSSSTVMVGKVSSLTHEVRNDAME
jgi:hypothetical protein